MTSAPAGCERGWKVEAADQLADSFLRQSSGSFRACVHAQACWDEPPAFFLIVRLLHRTTSVKDQEIKAPHLYFQKSDAGWLTLTYLITVMTQVSVKGVKRLSNSDTLGWWPVQTPNPKLRCLKTQGWGYSRLLTVFFSYQILIEPERFWYSGSWSISVFAISDFNIWYHSCPSHSETDNTELINMAAGGESEGSPHRMCAVKDKTYLWCQLHRWGYWNNQYDRICFDFHKCHFGVRAWSNKI